jgi:hypothetical protein
VQILPIEVPGKTGATVIDADKHVRPGFSLDDPFGINYRGFPGWPG